MQILIDATPLLLRSAGVKNYTYYWIQSLWEQASNDRISTFPALTRLGSLNHERSILGRARTYSHLGRVFAANRFPALPVLRWTMPTADVFHVSNQIRNPPKRLKLTATIYDMTCRLMPELHTAANIQADESLARNVLRRASRLIAISENSRQDAARLLGLDAERIEVIYPGVPEVYFGAQARPSERPYVLYVGAIEPRKNVDTLLDAWENFRLRGDFDLIVVGASGWAGEKTLARLAAQAERSAISRLRAGGRIAGADGGRERLRLSIVVRRLRLSGGAGDGGGSAGDYFEYVMSAGSRGRGRSAGGPAQRRGDSGRDGEIADVAGTAAGARSGWNGAGAAGISLERLRVGRAWNFSIALEATGPFRVR